MYEVEIYFVGGSGSKITGLSEETVENIFKWLDDKDDNKTFKITFEKYNKVSFYRKEMITFINVIEKS